MEATKKVPIKEGLWSAENPPRLIGSRCNTCGEVFFPKVGDGICANCQSDSLQEITLSRRGKIYSHTVVMQRPPVYYQGEVPYGLGFVELPEGVRVETLFTGCNFDDLRVGMEVEMLVDTLHEEEDGTEITCYKFKPVND